MSTTPAAHEGAAPVSEPRVDDIASFKELGLDSLDTVELLVAVEKEFKVELEDEEHEAVHNISDIIDKIYNHPRAV